MRVHSHPNLMAYVAAVFLSLFSAGIAFSQTSTISEAESQTGLGGAHSIVGMVLDPSGRPLQTRVRIRLATPTRGDRLFTTNQNGAFAFRGVPPGSYIVTIDKEAEYKPISQPIDVFRGTTAQTYTMNIRLEFKDRTGVKPAVVSAEFLNVPSQALAYYNSAIEQGKKGDRPAAIEQLKLAIAEYPSFAMAFNELGVQYLRLNRLTEADEAFQGALKIKPDLFAALINRGITYVMMKRYGEAVPILRKALTQHEQSPIGHYFLGQALANLGLFDDAEKELRTSLKLGKDEMKEAHRILAIIYSARGAKKQAAEELEAYLKLAPDTPDAEKIKESIRRLKESNQ